MTCIGGQSSGEIEAHLIMKNYGISMKEIRQIERSNGELNYRSYKDEKEKEEKKTKKPAKKKRKTANKK